MYNLQSRLKIFSIKHAHEKELFYFVRSISHTCTEQESPDKMSRMKHDVALQAKQ